MPGRLLVVDDEKEMCDLLKLALERSGHRVTAVTSATQAIEIVGQEDFDAVLTDLGMEGLSGIALCERLLGAKPGMPVIVVTGQGSLDNAIAALRAGAYDFITKPVDVKLLDWSVTRALDHLRLTQELKRLREVASKPNLIADLVGQSTAMQRLNDMVARVATTEASVLIHGETGTGKELIARAIHAASRRKEGPFVAINCPAVPQALIESELFGHAKGAFTDARSDRVGLFVQANGGTLFLDEIGELPLEVQPKLLRALQERKVRPVGSNAEVPFDVRVLAATHRDLEYEVFQKRFREDLFYRVNVVTLEVPSLRERPADVLLLAQHFLQRYGKANDKPVLSLSPPAAEKLLAYDWPGNVRELENCMERAVAMARFEQLTVEDLPEKVRGYRADRFVVSADDPTEVLPMDEVERRYILRVLGLVGGNKSQAAQLLGFDRRTLYRKLERYEKNKAEQQAPQSRTGTDGH